MLSLSRNESLAEEITQETFFKAMQNIKKFNGCVTVVLDGLYASGPVISICKQYGWEYMIVLKRDCLKTVWQDFEGLRAIEPENALEQEWLGRNQEYQWSNGIEYTYGRNHKLLKLNVVTCRETWFDESPRKGKPREMLADYAWISSEVVTCSNVALRCNDIARRRWKIENLFRVEKHNGYSCSHCFSYDWNAMKGFHCLMKFGVFINVLITCSDLMAGHVGANGIKGTIKKAWECLLIGGFPQDAPVPGGSAARNKGHRIRFRDFKLRRVA